MAYYVFSEQKKNLIESVFLSLSPDTIGRYYINTRNKVTGEINVPVSPTDQERVKTVLPVVLLETTFRTEHAEIKTMAENEAEFFTEDFMQLSNYLNNIKNAGTI